MAGREARQGPPEPPPGGPQASSPSGEKKLLKKKFLPYSGEKQKTSRKYFLRRNLSCCVLVFACGEKSARRNRQVWQAAHATSQEMGFPPLFSLVGVLVPRHNSCLKRCSATKYGLVLSAPGDVGTIFRLTVLRHLCNYVTRKKNERSPVQRVQ